MEQKESRRFGGLRWSTPWVASVLALTLLATCKGGDVTYTPAPVVHTAFDDVPGAHDLVKAPAGFKTTPEQAADWKAKAQSNQPFNDLQVRAEVHVLAPEHVDSVTVTGQQLHFPASAAAELAVALTPGTALMAEPASAAAIAAGTSNNRLGLLRRVKSAQVVGDEFVVETTKGSLTDVLVGGAAIQFPKVFNQINLTDADVDIHSILTDLPAQRTPTAGAQPKDHQAAGSKFGQKRGALTEEFAFGSKASFALDQTYDLDSLVQTIESLPIPGIASIAGGLGAKLTASGQAHVFTSLQFGAFVNVVIEETWTNPIPHLSYFIAGVGGIADLESTFNFDIAFAQDQGVELSKMDHVYRAIADNPVKWGPQIFELSAAKYFDGPYIPKTKIPTKFRLAPELKCVANIQGEIRASGSVKLDFDEAYAIEYKDGNWGTKTPTGFTKDFTWTTQKVAGGAAIRCGIGPRIDWLIADTAGPSATIYVGLDGSVHYDTICPDPGKIEQPVQAQGKITAALAVGIAVDLGVSIDSTAILGTDALSYHYESPVVEQFWPVWGKSWDIIPGFGQCPTDCHNNIQDAYETDVDCGGKSAGGACPVCEYHKKCNDNADCMMSYQCIGHICDTLPCNTNQLEAWETDVNCGGKCATAGYLCETGKNCSANSDCKSNLCEWGKCGTLQCNNQQKDWWETDVDCGGAYCPPCGGGQTCKNNKDCNAGSCNLFNDLSGMGGFGVCLVDVCKWNDYLEGSWAQKDDMTDVMCGGTCARVYVNTPATALACSFGPNDILADKRCGPDAFKCAVGKNCQEDGDCSSNLCANGMCIPLNCSDGLAGPGEADVDCGGKCQKKCGTDAHCDTQSDCISAICVPASVGTGNVCGMCTKNGKTDGYETDIDCGSQCTTAKTNGDRCKLGQQCQVDADCAIGYTTTWQGNSVDVQSASCLNNQCVPVCQNGVFDKGYESDLDCGKTCLKKCTLGHACTQGSDCDTSACLLNKCASACFNGKKDANEAGIDCGTACGNLCFNGATCSVGSDCFSGQCLKGVCGFDPCQDKKLSPGEGDIDCGGACDAKCATNSGCHADKDCQSGFCDGKTCQATSCTDKKQDSLETDIDCGGSCAAVSACALGNKCKAASDCITAICTTLGKCVADKCIDGYKDGIETDIDCGGNCGAKCTTGHGCGSNTDCDSKFCNGTVCVGDFCSDGVLSTGESDVDCGGPCKTCSTGAKCGGNHDCASTICAVGGTCVTSTCHDGKLSVTEADIDCGGTCPAPCLAGRHCAGGGDCASGICAAISLACVVTACQDEVVDGTETDVDCGGGCSGKCTLGKLCKINSDCASSYCDGQKCVATACEDKQLDGGEMGIDCGGPCSQKCVNGSACSGNVDCAGGFCDAIGHLCTVPCQDNQLDKGEADVDCGGVCSGQTCAVGKNCVVPNDCASGACSIGGVCVATACSDGKLSPGETDVDCGGVCANKCGFAKGCKLNQECQSGFCNGSQCVATACEDKQLDPGEADIDCGGTCSQKCATSQGCGADKDCTSGFCNGVSAKCVASQCDDNHLDAGESDVDCGGVCASSKTCAVSKTCAAGADCQSGVCSVNNACVATTCFDGRFTVGETDTDCGGTCAAACTSGQGCAASKDCDSGVCSIGLKCVGGACEDGKKSPGETDIDCGGNCAAKCATGAGCSVAGDCSSGFCDGTTCVATACFDKKKDVNETDVDCGGPCAAKCLAGKICSSGDDCGSGLCAATSKICVATTCADEIKDSTETDTDCGGACPAKCATQSGCTANGDCQSSFCDGQKCVSDPCVDHQKDQGESDIDCGHVCGVQCATASLCALPSDCQTGFCDGTTCVATACTDKKQDVGETGVDCGGPCATTCAVGLGCAVNADCSSGICAVVSLKCVATLCADEKIDGGESDIDCGGSCSNACATGKGCGANSDCQSTFCNGTACVADPCVDNQKDAGESDIDCGSVCSEKCALGGGCAVNNDCSSTFCDGKNCVSSHCLDKKADLGETGIDCGGPCGATCGIGGGCSGGTDCASGICAAISLACVATTCQDETKDGSETDIDCGGGCGVCITGKGCSSGSDCASGYCDGTVCVADHCSDKVRDLGETDVDCGGTCQTACGDGKICALPTDCTSSNCAFLSLVCVDNACMNQQKDSGESDVDCGGVCGSTCAVGARCQSAGDCSSGFCKAATGKCVATSCEDGVKSGNEVDVDCGGSCGACADGSVCTQASDCTSNLCLGTAGSMTCGCPYGSLAVKVTTGGVQTTECARNTGINGHWGSAGYVSNDGPAFMDSGKNLNWVKVPYANANNVPDVPWSDAVQYCDDLVLDGHDDWRLPTIAEVNTEYMFDTQVGFNGVGNGYRVEFPELIAAAGYPWWNASANAYTRFPIIWTINESPTSPQAAYALDCSSGNLMVAGCHWSDTDKSQSFAPICVRTIDKTPPPAIAKQRFTATNGGATIHDSVTGVDWLSSAPTVAQLGYSYYAAFQYCYSLSTAGYSWRVPSIGQLQSLIEPWRTGIWCDQTGVCMPPEVGGFTMLGMAMSNYLQPADFCNGSCFQVEMERMTSLNNTFYGSGQEYVRCTRNDQD